MVKRYAQSGGRVVEERTRQVTPLIQFPGAPAITLDRRNLLQIRNDRLRRADTRIRRNQTRQYINEVGERLRLQDLRDRQLEINNVRPVLVNVQRANIQELINQVRNRNADADVDFQIERDDDDGVDRSNCRDMLYCRRKTKSKYKRNKQNRRLGRVGQAIYKWVLTKKLRRHV
jgi:hypothetical protein